MAVHLPGERHHHPHELLGDVLLGLNDGIATTLVFALSVSGAATSQSTVVLAGLAEMLAGGVSFVAGAFVPVFPFLLHLPAAPVLAAFLSLTALFATGAARSRYSRRSWLRSGAEMVLVGTIGTVCGLAIGKVLSVHSL